MSNYISALFNLEGKVALLTGAGGFLVNEMSRSLATTGVKVVCYDAKLDHAERTRKKLRSS